MALASGSTRTDHSIRFRRAGPSRKTWPNTCSHGASESTPLFTGREPLHLEAFATRSSKTSLPSDVLTKRGLVRMAPCGWWERTPALSGLSGRAMKPADTVMAVQGRKRPHRRHHRATPNRSLCSDAQAERLRYSLGSEWKPPALRYWFFTNASRAALPRSVWSVKNPSMPVFKKTLISPTPSPYAFGSVDDL